MNIEYFDGSLCAFLTDPSSLTSVTSTASGAMRSTFALVIHLMSRSRRIDFEHALGVADAA